MSEESSVDRMIREARERGHAHHAKSEDLKEFLGKALERVIPKIMDPICEGLRRALGEPKRSRVMGHSALRHFVVSATSQATHVHAEIHVVLTGRGPEFSDPDKAHYVLSMVLHCRPHAHAPTGDVHKLAPDSDAFGEMRPGISAEAVQRAIEDESARLLKIHR
jgi:hypothetical protein